MTVILGSLFWSGQKATTPETETLPKQQGVVNEHQTYSWIREMGEIQ